MMSGLLSETGIMVALKLLKLMFVSRDEITNTQLDLPLIYLSEKDAITNTEGLLNEMCVWAGFTRP